MQPVPTIRKVPADFVPFGADICTRGRSVWAAYDGDKLVVVAATAKEARLKYQAMWRAEWAAAGFQRQR
jgi:hypothetical protein